MDSHDPPPCSPRHGDGMASAVSAASAVTLSSVRWSVKDPVFGVPEVAFPIGEKPGENTDIKKVNLAPVRGSDEQNVECTDDQVLLRVRLQNVKTEKEETTFPDADPLATLAELPQLPDLEPLRNNIERGRAAASAPAPTPPICEFCKQSHGSEHFPLSRCFFCK